MGIINFLRNLVSQLGQFLGMNDEGDSNNSEKENPQEYENFILELLQAEAESNNDFAVIYPMLAKRQHLLNARFSEILQQRATHLIAEQPEAIKSIVGHIEKLSIHIEDFPLGKRANNIEIAITGYQIVLSNREPGSEKFAQTQNNLGIAYNYRINGSRADNLERAIKFYQAALTVYTFEDFREYWAASQNNLGEAYRNRINGSRADNLERAIKFYQAALTVYTFEDFREYWAGVKHNLGEAYRNRINGSRADNLELAIKFYQAALRVRSLEDFRENWAMTQNGLAAAYYSRINGSRADNLERAIKFYQEALTVYTLEDFPEDWAMTQNGLAAAHYSRIKGSRADNLEQAIEFYQAALTVRTLEDFREKWAETQNGLAAAYLYKINGSRADNLERAIEFYQAALTVYTFKDFPEQWAMTQNGLAAAHYSRIKGSRADNLEQAIEFYQAALTVRTLEDFPENWAGVKHNLGAAYSDRINGSRADNLERAIEFYQAALTIRTRQAFPQNYTETLSNLGNLYRSNQQWQLAYDTYAPAIETVEFLRGEIQSVDETKQKLAEEWNKLYLGIVEVCIELQLYTEAVEYAERSKGQNLIELLSVKHLYPKGEIRPEVRQELQQLRLRIAEENLRLKQAEEKNNDLINQLRQELAEKYPYTPLKFGEIKQLADEKTAIVEWYILDNSFCVFIITKDNPQPQILSFPQSDSDRLLDWANQYLRDYYSNREQWQNSLETKLANLAEILHIDEILKSIPETCDKLILVPHRYLHLFPMHALPVSRENWQRFHPNNESCPPNPYLIDCFDDGVRYTPSCQLLHKVQQQPPRIFDSLFAIQTPTKDLYGKDNGVVNAIKKQFKDPIVLKEKEAKRSALLNLNDSEKTEANPKLQTTNCLFFYCHGSFKPNSPLESGLQLADKTLTLADIIAHFDLKNCRLVTMSACETSFTDFKSNSDEYIGLPSGFMLAGSHNIIGSLWTVSALAASLVMTKFYAELEQSNNIALALNQSQKWLRDVTVKELQDWLPKSKLEDVWQEELASILEEDEKNMGAGFQPFNSPCYWAAFCAIGKGV